MCKTLHHIRKGFTIRRFFFSVFLFFISLFASAFFPAYALSNAAFSERSDIIAQLPADSLVVIESISIRGNKTTRDHIIMREIEFSEKDTLSPGQLPILLEESIRNLQNTSLFNFVNSTILHGLSSNAFIVEFEFVERWYLWPSPIFSLTSVNFNQWIQKPVINQTNYGLLLVKDNFRGRRERMSFLLQGGYSKNFEFSYLIPYLTASQTLGLNVWLGYRQETRTHYLTRYNQRLFFDPQNGFALNNYFASVGLTLRKQIHVYHEWSVRYDQYSFHDSLRLLNPRFVSYQNDQPSFFSVYYKLKNDHRDQKYYPLTGHYFDLRLWRYGLGVFSQNNVDLTTFESSVRKYWKLNPRWYFASGLIVKISAGKHQPYYLQQGLGFLGDVVRGYENFFIDGQHFWVAKTNLKYALVPYHIYQMPFFHNQKFSLIHYRVFMNLFVDGGYVHDDFFHYENPYSNAMLGATGIGIDFVTYYDKVFRSEFSVSRHGNIGVFFHFIAPI
ncbi:MAG: POTRA domain-containing protein [Bacteroidota bacterium]